MYTQPSGGTSAVTPDTRWWTALGDITLNALITEGLAQNLSVAQAIELVAQARATARINGDSYDPSVNAPASASASGNTAASGITTSRAAIIDASWEVDFFGTARRNKAMQQANVDAAVEGANEARLTLIGDVSRTYVEIRSYQRRLALAKASLKTQQATTRRRAEAVRRRRLRCAGRRPVRGPVAEHRRLDPDARSRPPAADQRARRSDKTSGIPRVKTAIGAGIPADLIRNRPDIRQSERQLAAAVEKIGITEASLSLTLAGSLSTDGTLGSWSLGPTLTLPIFNHDRLQGNVDLAQSQARSAYLSDRATILAAVQDVEDAIVASYTKAADPSKQLYKAGTADYSEVLTAQRSLQSAQDSLAQSETTLATAYITLAKSLGGGWCASAK